MRVKILRDTVSAGPEGAYNWGMGWEGEVVDALGVALVQNGAASLVEVMAPPVADTTDLTPPVTAAGFSRRGKGRAR